jgi:hypothetical protein
LDADAVRKRLEEAGLDQILLREHRDGDGGAKENLSRFASPDVLEVAFLAGAAGLTLQIA